MYAYVGGDPVNGIDPAGLAYFAYRPLDAAKILGVTGGKEDDRQNTVIGHEQLFFEDENPISNIGFFNDGNTKEELDTKLYEPAHDPGWNDCVMREAIKRVKKGRYKLLWERRTNYKYNCQDWADAVRREYRELVTDPNISKKCAPTCDEINK